MPRENPFANFTLPGITLLNAQAQRIAAAFTFAYSFRFNTRRLESHFYSAWNYILLSLTVDDPNLFVCPQLVHYRDRSKDNDNGPPLSSKASISSERVSGADTVIPDFTIGRFISKPRVVGPNVAEPGAQEPASSASNMSKSAPSSAPLSTSTPSTTLPWYQLMTASACIEGFAELKRPCVRSADSPEDFMKGVDRQMEAALKQVAAQLFVMFNTDTYDVSDNVVCFAICGEWYKWMVAKKENYPLPPKLPPKWYNSAGSKKYAEQSSEDANEAENVARMVRPTDDDEQEFQLAPDQVILVDNDEPLAELDDDDNVEPIIEGSFPRFIDELLGNSAKFPQIQQEVDDINKLMPEYLDWSGYILYGSPASNQALSRIHSYLMSNRQATPRD
ncbi:hypothetical protein CPC08DRAFT_233860 [Agrocybe pediades]|nr:hypothetical protein CPC08DRAFT_233860 [Agrocybe pediades]